MNAMIVFSVIVAGFMVAFFCSKGYVQRVYDRTGYNGFTPVCLALSVCAGLPALLLGAVLGRPDLAAYCCALPLAALLALNFRAKRVDFVLALTFMQVVYGAFAPFFIAAWLVNRHLLDIDIPALSPKIEKPE